MTIRPLNTVPLRLALRSQNVYGTFMRRDAVWNRRVASLRSISFDAPIDGALTAPIHPYAGLGHQISNWLSGLLWARDLGLAYHGADITRDTEGIFAFGNSFTPTDLSNRKLPPVRSEKSTGSKELLMRKISAHDGPHRWILSTDQPRFDQTPAADEIRSAVLAGILGPEIRRFEKDPYIAVHIRRGDVSSTMNSDSRWVDASWHEDVVRNLRSVDRFKDLPIYAFASGTTEKFEGLRRRGVQIVQDGTMSSDFSRMAGAAVLVAAPSSFSFTAGLASAGLVMARHPWWHHIPDEQRWFRLDESGRFDSERAGRKVEER